MDQAAAAEGAIRTESGLIYKELQAGLGPSPGPTDLVAVRYSGKLINGKGFDYTAIYRDPRKISFKGHPRLGGGLAEDEGRRQGQTGDPTAPGLWAQGQEDLHPRLRGPDF